MFVLTNKLCMSLAVYKLFFHYLFQAVQLLEITSLQVKILLLCILRDFLWKKLIVWCKYILLPVLVESKCVTVVQFIVTSLLSQN